MIASCARIRKIVLAITFALFVVQAVSAADGDIAADTAAAAAASGVIVVRSISWDVDGKTQPWALKNAAKIEGDETFSDRESFERWLQERKQLLINERVLDSVEVDVVFVDNEDGTSAADLAFHVKDTFNIIALPYAQYDSNDGLELSIKARNYNFLGTMEPLKIDLGYELDSDLFHDRAFSKGSFFVELDSNTPFRAFDYDWNFDFDHFFGYTYDDAFEYENTTGVSIVFPLNGTKLEVGAYQGVSVNEKNDAEYVPTEGDRFDDVWYLSSWLQAYWTIPTGIRVDGFGDLNYVPRSIFKNNYRPGGDIGTQRRGPTFEIGHELTFGRVDWIGNFRKGIEASLDNGNVYNLYSEEWERNLKAGVSGYYPLSKLFGVSSRLTGVYYFDKPDDEAASYLRGLLDKSVTADYGLYLNMDFPFRLIRFVPSEWFGAHWMRFFNFEQHWSPFVDVGLLSSEDEGTSFGTEDARVTGGLEVITFPLMWRSFYVRISVGFDLREMMEERHIPGGDGRELFLGLSHQY